MTDVVHLRCGSDIQETLEKAGIEGDFISAGDPVCQGPVPAGLPDEQYRECRARYMADAWDAFGDYDYYRGRQAEDARNLARLDRYDKIVLWFEHDLYDQSILIQMLSGFLDRPELRDKLHMICIGDFPGVSRFVGLGQLSPEQLSTLYGTETSVTRGQMELARRAWSAYTTDTPEGVRDFIAGDSDDLPFLAAALARHLRELPWTDNGLNLTERLALRAVADGAATPGKVFGALVRELEPQPFLGDAMFWPILRGLSEGDAPAVTPLSDWSDEIELTAFGRALLSGDENLYAARECDRWWGAVHLTGTPQWQWDDDAKDIRKAA